MKDTNEKQPEETDQQSYTDSQPETETDATTAKLPEYFSMKLLPLIHEVYAGENYQMQRKIYFEEHRRRFETKNDTFKIKRNPVDENTLVLTINRQLIGEWLKKQWEKLRQGLQQAVEESRKSRRLKLQFRSI